MNVKYHLNQNSTDLSIAVSVFKNINPKNLEIDIPEMKDLHEIDIPEMKDLHEIDIPEMKDLHEIDIPEMKDLHEIDIPEMMNLYDLTEIPEMKENQKCIL